MVTIKDIALKCNVSATTVSNILNGKAKASRETKELVLQTVKEMGYQPNYIAQGLRNSKTRTIGIIAEDIAQFTTPRIIEGIMECCEANGYRTIVENLRLYARWRDSWYDKEKEYHSILDPVLQQMLSIKVDGIIYVAGHARLIHCVPKNFQVPAVMAYAYSGSDEVPSVAIDDTESAQEVVKYLLHMGHRKIGVIGGRADNIHTQKRLLGYQKALFEEKVLFDPELVAYANWDRETGYRAAEQLLDKGVTAFFCMSDRMAGGVYDLLEERSLTVGKEISVAGFDDQDIAEFFRPALTTTRLPLNEIGTEATKLLLKKIETGTARKEEKGKVLEVLVPCKIQIRKSVGKAE